MGGISGNYDIADVGLWRQHFDKLFNCIQGNYVNTRMINAEYSADIIVTSDKVAMAIRKLSTGISSGLDGIYGKHLLHCSQILVTTLALQDYLYMVFCQVVCSKLYLSLLSRTLLTALTI